MAKVAFFRGADFGRAIGVTDWRIGLYLPEYGHTTYIYGKGKSKITPQTKAFLISKPYIRIPVIGGILLSLFYASDALKKEVDVVVCNIWVFVGGVIVKLIDRRIKLILDVRSIPVEDKGIHGFLAEQYFRYCLKSNCYDAISIISDGMLNEIKEKYSLQSINHFIVWDSGYDDSIFKPTNHIADGKTENKLTLIFHGSLSKNRGLFEAVQAVNLLLRRGSKDIRLILIGNGNAQAALYNLVIRMNLQNNIFFIPQVNHDEIPSYLATADLGIDLLPDHSWWRHQSSLKVKEFIAMGLPVLATDLPCHRNISNAILLINNNNPSTIAQAIQDYENYPIEQKRSLSLIALADSKKHTWRAKAKILSDFIDNEIIRN
jgi:glycosyltransferase involved in cell wall biosynthesis